MPSWPSPRPSPTRRRRWPTIASPSPSWSGPWARSSESDEKGPSAALAPSAARSTYSEYASRAALGRRLAAGPFSSLSPERFSDELPAVTEAFAQVDEEWDAADLGCGELVLELK